MVCLHIVYNLLLAEYILNYNSNGLLKLKSKIEKHYGIKLKFNDKILNTTMLAINILLMIFGVVLISFPSIVDIAIKVVFGSWILFAGVKRLILAVAVSRIDKQSYKTFLVSSLIIITLGVFVLINFYNLVGVFLIIYSLTGFTPFIK